MNKKDYFPPLEKVKKEEMEETEDLMTDEQSAASQERLDEERKKILNEGEEDKYAVIEGDTVRAVASSKEEVIKELKDRADEQE